MTEIKKKKMKKKKKERKYRLDLPNLIRKRKEKQAVYKDLLRVVNMFIKAIW